jgi:hypothetical protein
MMHRDKGRPAGGSTVSHTVGAAFPLTRPPPRCGRGRRVSTGSVVARSYRRTSVFSHSRRAVEPRLSVQFSHARARGGAVRVSTHPAAPPSPSLRRLLRSSLAEPPKKAHDQPAWLRGSSLMKPTLCCWVLALTCLAPSHLLRPRLSEQSLQLSEQPL